MEWFWIALLAPLFFSLSVQVDKLLLSKYFKGDSTGILATSAFATILFIIPLAFFAESIWLPSHAIAAFVIVGMIDIAYLYPYLLALRKDEASLVAPLFQIIPVFYLIGGYFFLGETVAGRELWGMIIVIAASLLLVFNFQKMKWEWPVFFLMLAASLLLVTGGLLFKESALETNFPAALFWQYVGTFLAGLFLLVIPHYRRTLIVIWKKRQVLVPLTLFNEGINLVAVIAIRFATLLAPIGLVQSIGGFHPLFIFMWGVLIMFFLPGLGLREDLSKNSLFKKLCGGLLLLLGAWLIR